VVIFGRKTRGPRAEYGGLAPTPLAEAHRGKLAHGTAALRAQSDSGTQSLLGVLEGVLADSGNGLVHQSVATVGMWRGRESTPTRRAGVLRDGRIAGQREQRPVVRSRPLAVQTRLLFDAEGAEGGIVEQDPLSAPRHEDHVVEPSGGRLDQGDHGTAAIEVVTHQRGLGAKGMGLEAEGANPLDQGTRGDAPPARVGEIGKGLRAGLLCPPVAHDHGRGGTAAERLGLGQEGNVENDERRLWRLGGNHAAGEEALQSR